MKATAQMGGLTRERIERLRLTLKLLTDYDSSVNENEVDALCVLALQALDRPDPLGEQPTHFEMARTRMLRKRIADIVATHDAFVADPTKERAFALRHAVDKARGIGLTNAEQEKQEDYDCPHAYPHRYCETCKVDPCPIGLKRPPPPERP